MMPGDLSESNAVKRSDYSIFFNILVHALAFIGGLIISAVTLFLLAFNLDEIRPVIGFNGFYVFSGLIFFIVFLISGALLGFLWNKGGWKLGLSLGSSTVIASILYVLYGFLLYGDLISFETLIAFSSVTIPALLGGCVGSYFGASYKKRRRPNNGIV
jgi:hypothetical protein